MTTRNKMAAVALVLGVLAGTCQAVEVAENWTKHCAACHGKDGKGETKAGKKADVKSLADAKYQDNFTDEQMFKQIKDGMKDKNGKEKMKPFAGLLSEAEIKGLVTFVRGLKK